MLMLLYYPQTEIVQQWMGQLVHRTGLLLLMFDLLEALDSVVLVRMELALQPFPLLQLTIFLDPDWWVPAFLLNLPPKLCECMKNTNRPCASCWIFPLEFSDSFAVSQDWKPGFTVTLMIIK